jgi:RNA polymerase sigma factor (sigma-70 family)
LGDLLSDGFIGLHSAVHRFDPSRRVPFHYFASRKIYGAMMDGCRTRDWTRHRFRNRTDNLPRMRALTFDPLTESDEQDPIDERDWIDQRMIEMRRRTRLVFQLYYLEELSMRQVADCLGISESSVSQVRARMLRKLDLLTDKIR